MLYIIKMSKTSLHINVITILLQLENPAAGKVLKSDQI